MKDRQHVMFVFLFLVYFTQYDLFTHLAESINLTEQFVNYFFFTTEWYFIVHVYHIFIINFPAGEYLDCFHFLAIRNRVTMNTAGLYLSIAMLSTLRIY